MTTAVDTNVLLDVLIQDPDFASRSERALLEAGTVGPLIVCEAVYGELAARFRQRQALDRFLDQVGVTRRPSDQAVLFAAGTAWREYSQRRPQRMSCPHCGAGVDLQCGSCGRAISPRQHLITDFLIGAHAALTAGRLLTRDHGYYRTYFPELVLVGDW